MSDWRPDGCLDAAVMRRCLHELLKRTDLGAGFMSSDTARLPRAIRTFVEQQERGREQVRDEARGMLREIDDLAPESKTP